MISILDIMNLIIIIGLQDFNMKIINMSVRFGETYITIINFSKSGKFRANKKVTQNLNV